MWCATFFLPNGTWCVPTATMTRPGASWITPRTGSGSGSAGRRWSARQVLPQPADVGGEAAAGVWGLADGRGARRADHAEQQRRVDGPGGDVGVPVPARAELIARVVAVHQVDPAGDRLDPVDGVGEVDASRVGVAGVQAEPDVLAVPGGGVGDRVPEPGDRVQRPGHGAVPAG